MLHFVKGVPHFFKYKFLPEQGYHRFYIALDDRLVSVDILELVRRDKRQLEQVSSFHPGGDHIP